MSPTPGGTRVFGSSVRFLREDGSQYRHYVVSGDVLDEDGERFAPSPTRMRDMDADISVNGMKRKQSPLKRDSLKSRYSPVRAGSRRRQRWERERDMLRGLELTEEEVRALYQVTTYSAFTELFEDGNLMAKWASFCSAPEEVQDEISKPPGRHINLPKLTNDPSELYLRMSSRARGMLERGVGVNFLQAFEAALLQRVYGGNASAEIVCDQDWDLESTAGGAKVTLVESLSRLVCHAVCVFYSLSSFSVQEGNAKTLLISWSDPPPPKPTSTLTHYLTTVVTPTAVA